MTLMKGTMDASPAEARSLVAAVVLAAGTARRMGRQKLLLDLGGRPIARWVVEAAVASGAMDVIVVLGSEADQVASAIGDSRIRTVLNPDFASGMASSLRVGLGAVSPDAQAAVIILGDQPLLQPHIIDRIIAVFETAGKPIVAPVYNGVQGNPVCFARALFPELLALTGDRGAKQVVERDPGRVERVSFDTDLPLMDLDVEKDYDALRRQFS